jgi:hypothetical protein
MKAFFIDGGSISNFFNEHFHNPKEVFHTWIAIFG